MGVSLWKYPGRARGESLMRASTTRNLDGAGVGAVDTQPKSLVSALSTDAFARSRSGHPSQPIYHSRLAMQSTKRLLVSTAAAAAADSGDTSEPGPVS